MDQTSQAKANEGATNGDTDENPANSYALTTYDDQQPVPLASVPPSSPAAGGVTFVPLSASAYPAIVIPPPPPLSNPHEIAFQQQLQVLWLAEAEQQQQAAAGEAKKTQHQHSLPLARIKKIMKADKDVKMIAAEVPVVFARACEMFILELTLRAWLHAEGARRRTLQRGDVTAAINGTEAYDFLADVVPEEERSSWSRGDDGVPPATTTVAAMPVVVPPLASYGLAPVTASVPFATYANMQPVTYMWAPPPPEHHHQQNFDTGRDQQE